LRDNEYNLNKILAGEKSRQIRDLIDKNLCPQCWTPCEAYQMIMADLFKL